MSDTLNETKKDGTEQAVKANLDPVKIKDNWFWVKNATTGSASVSTTFVLIAFLLTSLSFVMNMFEGQIFGFTLRPFDVGAVNSYLTPMILLYFGRRFTEAKYK